MMIRICNPYFWISGETGVSLPAMIHSLGPLQGTFSLAGVYLWMGRTGVAAPTFLLSFPFLLRRFHDSFDLFVLEETIPFPLQI